MIKEMHDNGFKELVQAPLEKNDPASFELVKNFFHSVQQNGADPFGLFLQRFTNKKFKNIEAREQWRFILHHKAAMEKKLGRRFDIRVAALDYFEGINSVGRWQPVNASLSIPDALLEGNNHDQLLRNAYSAEDHLVHLKKEVTRAKRYKHALSAIMLEVDHGKPPQGFSPKKREDIFGIIIKIIKKTIRSVDILTRCTETRFLIILPNTNKREANELAERIRQNIYERTQRVLDPGSGLAATLSVGQASGNGNSNEFIRHLEMALEEGKARKQNMVYSF